MVTKPRPNRFPQLKLDVAEMRKKLTLLKRGKLISAAKKPKRNKLS